ncbi:type II secretion system major pseudopilin GspG [Desulfovibrio inopinatus]|uniref:type II secretion system major pseudopilin GspG n=1 Tax=Desulfovibrio inopinatus TaxID=102109 RepID=UPI00041D2B68|nr:type II secretion system major pseudopilin GspG [Desulfovibrio inopinatus]
MPQDHRKTRQAGFTLIELMVVIVILGVLAGLVLPRIMDQPDKARAVKAKMQMESLAMALNQYKLDNGVYPTTEQGLNALVQKPTIGRIPRNYPNNGYLQTMPKDPWNYDYVYLSPAENGDFEIISLGADNQEGGEDADADIRSTDLN